MSISLQPAAEDPLLLCTEREPQKQLHLARAFDTQQHVPFCGAVGANGVTGNTIGAAPERSCRRGSGTQRICG